MLHNVYGSTGGSEYENPGIVDFEEDVLHTVNKSVREQMADLFSTLRPVKWMLILLPVFAVQLAVFGVASEGAQAGLFVTAMLCLFPLSVMLVEVMEDLAVHCDSAALGILVNVVFEHTAEILFSVRALWQYVQYEQRSSARLKGWSNRLQGMSICWVKPVLVGCVLFELLVVLGAAVLVSPVLDDTAAEGARRLWTFGSSSLLTTVAVFMFPTVYALTVQDQDKVAGQKALVAVSRLLCGLVLIVYAVYIAQVRQRYRWEASRNTPSSLSCAVLQRERAAPTKPALSRDPLFTPRFSPRFAIATAVVLFILCFIMVDCVILTLTSVVALTPVSLPFMLVIVIPCAFRQASLWAALILARVGRIDLAGNSAISAVVNIFLFILPVSVLVAWAMGAPLHASIHPFLALSCLLSVVVVSQITLAQHEMWIGGTLLVVLYLLVAVISLVGGWQLCYKLM